MAEMTRDDVIAACANSRSLRGRDLSGLDLSHLDLRRVDFYGANLIDATLTGANLTGANLIGANLIGANLTRATLTRATLPTGEAWETYLAEALPALCTAGGVALTEVARHFDCHDWTNCPMAAAFGAHNLSEVPVYHRPRAEQFVQLFDSRLIGVQVAGDSVTFVDAVAAQRAEEASRADA